MSFHKKLKFVKKLNFKLLKNLKNHSKGFFLLFLVGKSFQNNEINFIKKVLKSFSSQEVIQKLQFPFEKKSFRSLMMKKAFQKL